MTPRRPKIAVIGHVEHVTIARVDALPHAGDILHLDDPIVIAGGGGGIAFHQLAKSDAELHLFTAFGNDDAARTVEASVRATRAHIHAAHRDEAHTRDIVLITPNGERTILVVGEPLHPRIDDPLPWALLPECDAVYFTAQDPAVLRVAREARLLVVTARRKAALDVSGVRADVVVGSARDPLEASTLADYAVPPGALVMTEGASGGRVETAVGERRFYPGLALRRIVSSYGAGDSFAGALVWYLAGGGVDAGSRVEWAAAHGVAVLFGIDPIASQRPLDGSPPLPLLASQPRMQIDDDWAGWHEVRDRLHAAIVETARRVSHTDAAVSFTTWNSGNDMVLCSGGVSFVRYTKIVSFTFQFQARREIQAIRAAAGLFEEGPDDAYRDMAELAERDIRVDSEVSATEEIFAYVSDAESFLLDRAELIANTLAKLKQD